MFYNPLLPIINIIKKFLYFISKKIFILLLIIVFLAFFIILSFISESKAYNINQANINTTDYDIILEDNTIYNNIVTSAVQKWHTEVQASPNIILYNDTANSNYVVMLCVPSRCNCSFNNNDIIITNNFSNSNTGVWRYVYWYDGSFRYTNKDISLAPNTSTTTGVNNESYLYSNIILYNTNDNIIYPVGWSTITEPYIQTPTTDIENWSFDYLTIISDIDITNATDFQLNLTYGDFYDMDVTEYLTYDSSINNTWVISIPRSVLFNNVLFNDSENYLIFRLLINGVGTYDLGSYELNLTTSQIANINAQKNANQLNNINSNIDNDNISSGYGSSFSGFSNGMNITDNTSIDSIFNMIYQAFTHDYYESQTWVEPQKLIITLPVTNQEIEISPYTVYGRNYYTEQDKPIITIIKNLLSGVYWFLIGYWVLKDIRGTINKVAEGNIEDSSSDIKKEIL